MFAGLNVQSLFDTVFGTRGGMFFMLPAASAAAAVCFEKTERRLCS